MSSAPRSAEPLAGARVLVPRAREQAGELSDRVRALGGEPVEAPVLIIEPGDAEALADAIEELADGAFAAVCFTSPNGVAGFSAALRLTGHAASVILEAPVIACVGPGTQGALTRELGVTAELVPDVATTEALGEAFPPGLGRVLLPRADIASPVLPRLLGAKGYEPVEVVAYRTQRPERLPGEVVGQLASGEIDLVAIASPSTARNLIELMEGEPIAGQIVSIGPVTSQACEQLGLSVAVEADPHDLDGLQAALVAAYRPR